jgi:hypothetical protein
MRNDCGSASDNADCGGCCLGTEEIGLLLRRFSGPNGYDQFVSARTCRGCNLCSITTNQEAIRPLFRVINRYVGNLPSMPGVFPDIQAPVVRSAGDEREMVLMRWGMPPPSLPCLPFTSAADCELAL